MQTESMCNVSADHIRTNITNKRTLTRSSETISIGTWVTHSSWSGVVVAKSTRLWNRQNTVI